MLERFKYALLASAIAANVFRRSGNTTAGYRELRTTVGDDGGPDELERMLEPDHEGATIGRSLPRNL